VQAGLESGGWCSYDLIAISKANPDIIVFEFDNPVADQLHLLLEAPHTSVTDVAITAGFTDACYFARIFRRAQKPDRI
jgi:hypothetical protein